MRRPITRKLPALITQSTTDDGSGTIVAWPVTSGLSYVVPLPVLVNESDERECRCLVGESCTPKAAKQPVTELHAQGSHIPATSIGGKARNRDRARPRAIDAHHGVTVAAITTNVENQVAGRIKKIEIRSQGNDGCVAGRWKRCQGDQARKRGVIKRIRLVGPAEFPKGP